MKPKVILDESKYGSGLRGAWRWSFHEKNWRKSKKDTEKDESSLITVTEDKEPILIAVTKKQYKLFSKKEIFAVKRPKLDLWRDQISRIIYFLKKYRHFWIIRLKSHVYIYLFGYYIIVSKYGLRIIKPKKNVGLFRSLYEYYIHHRYRNIGINR
jgi:hypothetical protein